MDCNNSTCTSTRRGLFSIQKEFTCAICHELFVKAHTLSCSHSYCERCISSWLKKCQQCPTCRKPIEGKPVYSISLDNAVGKLVELRVENFAERLKKNTNAIQSSTGAIQKNTRATPVPKQAECSTQTSPQQSRDSSRNKNYNNSTFVRHIFHSYNGGPLHEFHYCNGSCHEYDDYSDDEYSDDYSNDDDDDYYDDYNGLPGYYWGGYGACFNCGEYVLMCDGHVSLFILLQVILITGPMVVLRLTGNVSSSSLNVS